MSVRRRFSSTPTPAIPDVVRATAFSVDARPSQRPKVRRRFLGLLLVVALLPAALEANHTGNERALDARYHRFMLHRAEYARVEATLRALRPPTGIRQQYATCTELCWSSHLFPSALASRLQRIVTDGHSVQPAWVGPCPARFVCGVAVEGKVDGYNVTIFASAGRKVVHGAPPRGAILQPPRTHLLRRHRRASEGRAYLYGSEIWSFVEEPESLGREEESVD